MAETTEATGRTLDEAKKAAAEALGVSVDQCDFEVIEGASKGLFAKTNYRVKATVKEVGKAAVEVAPKKRPAPTGERKGRSRKEDTAGPAPEKPAGPEPGTASEVVATQDDAKSAAEMLSGMISAAELDLEVEVEGVTGRYVNLAIVGDDVDALVGNKGAALDSLQYLSNAMLGRVLSNGVRVTLDAGEYRSHRAAALEKLAQDVAAAVADRKQEAVLDALPAHERRVIHNALKDHGAVETYSEGEEPNRRVVISPKP